MPGRLAPPDPGPSHGSPGGLPDQLQLLEPAARGSLAHFKLPQLITSLSHRSTPGSPAPSGPRPSHGSPGGLPDQLQLLKPAVAASSLISSSFGSSPPLPSPLILSSPANTDYRLRRSQPTILFFPAPTRSPPLSTPPSLLCPRRQTAAATSASPGDWRTLHPFRLIERPPRLPLSSLDAGKPGAVRPEALSWLPWRTARSTPTPQARCRGFLAHLKLLRLITSSLVASNPLLPRQHRLPSPSFPTDEPASLSSRDGASALPPQRRARGLTLPTTSANHQPSAIDCDVVNLYRPQCR
jgi:hypothetical protein